MSAEKEGDTEGRRDAERYPSLQTPGRAKPDWARKRTEVSSVGKGEEGGEVWKQEQIHDLEKLQLEPA